MSIVPDTLIGYPGDTLKFFGSLTNNTDSTVFVNNDSILFPLSVDDLPFLTFAPVSLAPSEVSGTFEFLDVTIPLGQSPGTYDGTIIVFGGSSGTDTSSLGTGAFHVTVDTLSPEPASMVLVGLGLVGASLLARRRRLDRARSRTN